MHGFVAPGFEGVRDAFARNFAAHGEVGAACCVYWHGEPVVDLHAGLADRETGRPWRDDTLQLVFSATKGVTAAQLALAWLLAQGNDIAPIPGTKRRATLAENLGAADLTLTADDLAALDAAFPPDAVAGERYNEDTMKLVDR